MKESKKFSLKELFITFQANINWTDTWQKNFYESSKEQFAKFGYLTRKQYNCLLKTVTQISRKRSRAHHFEDYQSNRRKRS